MDNEFQDVWWTRREAAAYVHVSEATIGREVRQGRLRHARVGGRRSLRFRRQWLDDWLTNSQPVEGPAAPTNGSAPTPLTVTRYIRVARQSH